MNYRKQAAVTQPVQELRRDGIEFLIHTDTGEEVLEKINHLAPVLEFVRSPEYRCIPGEPIKLLFLSEDEYTAKQAALAFMSLHCVMKDFSKVNERDEMDERCDRFFDFFSEAAEEKKEASAPYDKVTWEKDFLVLTPGELSEKCQEMQRPLEAVTLIFQQNAGNPELQKIMSLAQNIYIDCFREKASDALIDAVKDLKKDMVVIAAPDSEAMRYYVKRFSFEAGFHIIKLRKPGINYYPGLLERYLEKCGASVDKDIEFPALVQKLRIYRGSLFRECDIFCLADGAIGKAGRKYLKAEDFLLYGEEEQSGLEQMNRLIGLAGVKKVVKASAAMHMMQSRHRSENISRHNNLAFVGPPGTGKTMMAEIYGKIMAELGVSNGKFVSAGRRDMIGEYLGHTAGKMAALFERARGGVLFIDEAGSLTAKDEFTRECVIELIRYMEEQPETTVIFATYPSEMDLLMKSDAGFPSRISRVIRFEGYSDEELYGIFRMMAMDNGFSLTEDAEKAVYGYIGECRLMQGEYFGYAREMRRLFEASAEVYSLRLMDGGSENGRILGADVQAAGQELLPVKMAKHIIGFQK